jgi:hypothetical protein
VGQGRQGGQNQIALIRKGRLDLRPEWMNLNRALHRQISMTDFAQPYNDAARTLTTFWFISLNSDIQSRRINREHGVSLSEERDGAVPPCERIFSSLRRQIMRAIRRENCRNSWRSCLDM